MSDTAEIISVLARHEEFVLLGGLALCVITGIVFGTFSKIVTSLARERTRREIAAYIAEGSITADEGERLLRADIGEKQDA